MRNDIACMKVVMVHFKRRNSDYGKTREPPKFFVDSS